MNIHTQPPVKEVSDLKYSVVIHHYILLVNTLTYKYNTVRFTVLSIKISFCAGTGIHMNSTTSTPTHVTILNTFICTMVL